jgi:hypothetical protein
MALAMNADAMCTGPDDACDCQVTSMDATPADGTYEIVDQTVVLTVDETTSGIPYPYCVDVDRLDLWAALVEGEITREMCTDLADCEAALGDMYDFYGCVM